MPYMLSKDTKPFRILFHHQIIKLSFHIQLEAKLILSLVAKHKTTKFQQQHNYIK
jgi:hypothetical protein